MCSNALPVDVVQVTAVCLALADSVAVSMDTVRSDHDGLKSTDI